MSTDTFPSYHNEPLRLTVDEIENPINVINEFFQDYHLPDIRACLHCWLQDSMHKDSVESKKHYWTHTDIEKLVEACWLIRKGILKTNNSNFSAISNPIVTEILGKKVQLIEMVKSNPAYVIQEIFRTHTLTDLRELIRDWHFVATTTECSVYDEAEQRRQLLLLINGIYPFIEAMYIINSVGQQMPIKDDSKGENDIEYLNKDQRANPVEIISSFFDKFPLLYIRRELHDCLRAGLSYAGEWPRNFTEGGVLDGFEIFSCLFESAYNLVFSPNQKAN